MLKYLFLITLSLSVLMFTGCALVPSPVGISIYGDVTYPGFITTEQSGNKVGRAMCTSILGIGFGDCSIEAAKKTGGITTVNTVDHKANTILFLYSTYETIVTGR